MKSRSFIMKLALLLLIGAVPLSGCSQEKDTSFSPGDVVMKGEGQTIETEVSDLSDLSVVYSKDFSKDDSHPETDEFSDDWNVDGIKDRLKIEAGEAEGSQSIKRFELEISGAKQPFILEQKSYDFVHIFQGDFDGDGEQEIGLLFDIRYNGANGGLGLYLLKQTDDIWKNVLGDEIFSGFSYRVSTDAQKGTYEITSEKNGQEYVLEKQSINESAIGEVTPFYGIEVLSGAEKDYIRIRQYIAGEDMTDHVGDVVSVFCLEDGNVRLVEEYVE